MNNLVLISCCQYLLLGLKYLYKKNAAVSGECRVFNSLKEYDAYNVKNTTMIIDIRDDYFEAFRLLQIFRCKNPDAKIVVILSCHSSIYFKLTAHGLANGIATINDPIDELVELIFSVSGDESMTTKAILEEKESSTSNRVEKISITPCEITVFDSVMKGISLTTLACIDGRSIKTLSHHKRNLMKKFGIITNIELYRLAKDQLRI